MYKQLARPVAGTDTDPKAGTKRSLRRRAAHIALATSIAVMLPACGFFDDGDNAGVAADPASGTTPVAETVAPQAAAAATVSRTGGTTNQATSTRPTTTTTTTATTPTSTTTTTTGTQVSGTINTVDTIVNDMKLNNDLRLAGIPLERGWATGTGFVVMGNDPRGTRTPTWWNPGNTYYKSSAWWTHIVPWMVIFDGEGNAATNTRVELRELKAYYKSRATGQWILLARGAIEGQNYPKYLNASSSGTPDIVSLGSGSVSVRPPTTDLHFHGWCCGRALPNPADIAAIHVTTQARLAVHDRNRPDDRAAARYLVQVGGDYYPDASLNVGAFAPDSWNPGIGLSRSKLVGNNWQSYSFTTINVGSQIMPGASISEAELRSAPPPMD